MRFYFGMSGEQVSSKAASAVGGRPARYRSRLRRQERQAKTKRAAVVLSLFLALLAATLLVGGRTLIGPLLGRAAADREANRVGDVVLVMPDGNFCRHMSFDNNTAEVIEGGVQQCAVDRATRNVDRNASFRWGAR